MLFLVGGCFSLKSDYERVGLVDKGFPSWAKKGLLIFGVIIVFLVLSYFFRWLLVVGIILLFVVFLKRAEDWRLKWKF